MVKHYLSSSDENSRKFTGNLRNSKILTFPPLAHPQTEAPVRDIHAPDHGSRLSSRRHSETHDYCLTGRAGALLAAVAVDHVTVIHALHSTKM